MNEKTILFVDDEPSILSSLKRLLRKEGYKLLFAESGKEGLSILKDNFAHLIVSDQRMPEMTGVHFLKEVKKRHPNSIRIILSGYADVASIVEAINTGEIYRFLTKPWNDDELKTTLKQCLEHYDLIKQRNELIKTTEEQNEKLKHLNAQLEEMISQRTLVLQLSQEIIEMVPVSIVGIGHDRMVVMLNNAVLKTFPEFRRIPIGNDIKKFFPPEICSAVERILEGQSQKKDITIKWNDTSVRSVINPIKTMDNINGCLMILEVLSNEKFSC